MAKIEFVAFGGQDERDKACSALIINNDIYVLGCGIRVPSNVMFGIKKITPDFSYLVENQQRIKCIFIGVASYSNFGSLEYLMKLIPNVPIYTSYLGRFVINNYFKQRALKEQTQNVMQLKQQERFFNIVALKPLESIKIGSIQVSGFRTASYMPNSFGFIFNTDSGAIIYIDEYIIPTNNNPGFSDVVFEVNKITNNNNFLLISNVGSKNIDCKGFTSPNYSILDFYDKITTSLDGRLIVAIDDEDIYKVIALAATASKKTLPFAIFSNTLSKTFTYMQENKFFTLPHLISLDETKLNEIEKGIIVISGTKQRLIAKLNKIIDDEDPKMTFKKTDTFVYAMKTVSGYEKIEANLFDELNRLKIKDLIKLPSTITQMCQSQEDSKFLINVFKPKYVIPYKGFYMDFVKYTDAIKSASMIKNNIILVENGEVVTFDNATLVPGKRKRLRIEEQYIGTQGVYDVAANSLFERNQMSTDGCILASILVNTKQKNVSHSNFNPVGVINIADEKQKVIADEINSFLVTMFNDFLKPLKEHEGVSKDQINYFKKQIVKQYEKKFGKRPLVLLSIIYDNAIKGVNRK